MPYQNLLFEVREGVAHITLNRPKAANAIDLRTAQELADAAIRCDEETGVRAVLLSGKGKIFCGGGDLRSMSEAERGMPALIKEITGHLHLAIARFARMDAPLVAAVGGNAAGAGMSLACAADLLICGESASFLMAYTKAALAPDGSSTWFLPRLVGPRRALELILTNRVLSAEEAVAWGIANRVVPDEKLEAEAEALAGELARGATLAFGLAKRLLVHSASTPLETQMELESRAIADAARSEDAREGAIAFLKKRSPEFRGR